MNWFDTSGLTSLAKNALKEAQKTIDKALDIQDDSSEEDAEPAAAEAAGKDAPATGSTPQKDAADFFSSWGLTVSAESAKDEPLTEQPVVTASPSKAASQSVWGSFAGSFFEQPKSDEVSAIVRPPKAKSMNVIADAKYGSQDDLFSKSQLVMADGETTEFVDVKCHKPEERRGSSRSNRLSLVSSLNSSDSVEVLSQSLKTTPESPSVQSISERSSMGHKKNSESVEVLPDSLLSPSSIECLGFDSYSSPSSNLSPDSSEKPTPVGDKTDKIQTADSVSLVADDDEDTMSYNSISECTAPTVLDTDDKPLTPFTKPFRIEPQKRLEKEFVHLEQPAIPQRMQVSENSSNDGSWSDRTLNADNDSVNFDMTTEDVKKEIDHEDVLMEKLSDSSSYYNMNVSSADMIKSESSAFVNVEKQQCSASHSSNSSQKEGSVKERVSPVSSESKSDLVKIGSDRTSGHTSGDELETATSSDIEIIPSPNGDGHSFCRNSPAKYAFKQGKFDGSTSPNLVDLVLGKSLATKIRGHNRELSEASIQSNTSDESQGSENERLMRRLCEMAEILEARENKLMEVSRSYAELAEANHTLKSQFETLLAKHEGGDNINTITEDYTQRMSALEKKFQQAIREKDQLRKQLDTLKADSTSRKISSELENALKEKDETIAGLQEEGEKLAKQQFQNSKIIKKLREKEKDNEQVIKSLRDKICEQSAELERMKRSMAAKEELEVRQIEAVYRLTTHNSKLQAQLNETKSALDDTTQKLETARTSLDAARRELTEEAARSHELQRRKTCTAQLQADRERLEAECERRTAEVHRLRAELAQEEKRWVGRTEALRLELREAREAISALEARAAEGGAGGGTGGAGAALLSQLAALQRSALEREQAHALTTRSLSQQLAEAQACAARAADRERAARDETRRLQEQAATSEGLLQDARARLEEVSARCGQCVARVHALEGELASKSLELESQRAEHERRVSELEARALAAGQQAAAARDALDGERRRSAILQEQLSAGAMAGGVAGAGAGVGLGGDVSPPHSVHSDSFSGSLWAGEDGSITPIPLPTSALCMEDTLAQLTRRTGELRANAHTAAQLRAETHALRARLAQVQAELDEMRAVQEQYDALLQMYGEKEEQLEELRLDLQDVTQLYKQQLDELIALKQRRV